MISSLYRYARAMILGAALLFGAGASLGLLTTVTSAVEFGKREPLTIVTGTGKNEFQVEIADDDAKREQGLMYRRMMPAFEGMLFDFKTPQLVYFWMKNTFLPLDMIFIRADGTVARVAENTTPFSEAVVPSESEVRFVLEINAGVSKTIGLKPGDKVATRLIGSDAK